MSSNILNVKFYNVRNISCPEDHDNGRKIYVGQLPIKSVINIPTDENVRDYLLEAEGKKRRVPTQVNRAIRGTLDTNPENFTVLNSGIVIVARNCEIDEKAKILKLTKPSIINGSQTQGVIKDFFTEYTSGDADNGILNIHVKFELVVTADEGLIAETSISRNFQNDVLTISIVGRLGQLDELEKSLQAKLPGTKLKKSETKLSEDYVQTERLLQVITALIPKELWPSSRREFSKVYSYSMKTKCLKEFQDIVKRVEDPSDPEHGKYVELYQFYLDICADALELYNKWKKHQGFKGTRIRAIERDGNAIKSVPDGIIFPVLASLSAFAKKDDGRWTISPPQSFSDEELINAAVSTYQEIASSNPGTMGKSKACYSALYQITSIYQKLSK